MSAWSEPVPTAPAPPRPALGYAVALAMVAAALAIALLTEQVATIPNLSLVFVLPVVIAAAWYGWGPALTAAAAGAVGFNFFLLEPRFTLRVEDPANIWALALLLGVAAIVSAVAAESRRRAVAAREHAAHAEVLQGLARQLVAATDRKAIFEAAVQAVAGWFGAPAVILADDGAGLEVQAISGPGDLTRADLAPADRDAAGWTLAARLPTRGGAYPADDACFDFWPLPTVQAAIGVDLSRRDEGRPPAPERLVEAVGDYLTVALQRELYGRRALEAGVRAQGEELKANLLAAVSHDLKTPLSTILFTLQSLQKFADAHDPAARAELLALAEAETARLSGLVGNLLDMSRLDADAVSVNQEAVSMADLASTAAARAHAALDGHPLLVEIDGAAPLVWIDYPLAETALANVLENAGKYSPPGSPVRISAKACDDGGVIEVRDDGPGFPQAIAPLFEKFTRGVQGDGRPPGVGLGLAIARGFLEVQGGRIEAGARPDGPGGLVRLTLPLARTEVS